MNHLPTINFQGMLFFGSVAYVAILDGLSLCTNIILVEGLE